MSETLIRVEGVSKKFCRSLKKSLWYGMQDLGRELSGRRHGGDGNLRPDEFWAVKDVSFELKRGECLGLIGHNGAGKTTLLRMMNGLIKPDAGRIEMRGRLGALIALGAGFNPILTGRENIHVNGSVLGLTKREIDAKFDEIVDFAEIGEFIDMPVQSYSSGMAVRLGFAVASSLKPDILILDEVLAVGDVGFRTKCYNRIYEVANNAAVIFVSHSMPQIARLSTTTLLLSSGESIYHGDVSKGIELYSESFSCSEGNLQIADGVELKRIMINGQKNKQEISVIAGDPLVVEAQLKLPLEVKSLEVSLTIHQPSLESISHINSNQMENELVSSSDSCLITIKIPSLTLGNGRKFLTLTLRNHETNTVLLWASAMWTLNVINKTYVPAPVYHDASFNIENR